MNDVPSNVSPQSSVDFTRKEFADSSTKYLPRSAVQDTSGLNSVRDSRSDNENMGVDGENSTGKEVGVAGINEQDRIKSADLPQSYQSRSSIPEPDIVGGEPGFRDLFTWLYCIKKTTADIASARRARAEALKFYDSKLAVYEQQTKFFEGNVLRLMEAWDKRKIQTHLGTVSKLSREIVEVENVSEFEEDCRTHGFTKEVIDTKKAIRAIEQSKVPLRGTSIRTSTVLRIRRVKDENPNGDPQPTTDQEPDDESV